MLLTGIGKRKKSKPGEKMTIQSAVRVTSSNNGAFAFYNYSQSNVLYSAIEEDVATVPAPAGLGLLALGLLAMRARRSA